MAKKKTTKTDKKSNAPLKATAAEHEVQDTEKAGAAQAAEESGITQGCGKTDEKAPAAQTHQSGPKKTAKGGTHGSGRRAHPCGEACESARAGKQPDGRARGSTRAGKYPDSGVRGGARAGTGQYIPQKERRVYRFGVLPLCQNRRPGGCDVRAPQGAGEAELRREGHPPPLQVHPVGVSAENDLPGLF